MLTYFPLRSNASALVAGAPVNALLTRVKTAALLGNVVLEDGLYTVEAGSHGSTCFHVPMPPPELAKWQTAPARGQVQNGQFSIAMSPTGSDQPPQVVLQSDAQISWHATFVPVKTELNRSYEWLSFENVGLNREGKDLAENLKRTDERAKLLLDQETEPYVRSRVLEHAAIDSVVATGLEAAVSMDRRHAPVTYARVTAGTASVIVEESAVRVLVPNVAALSWEDIDELRRQRGWSELRDVWTEVSSIAYQDAMTHAELAQIIRDEFEDRLIEAARNAEKPTGASRWIGTALSAVAGFATAHVIPGADSTVASAAASAVADLASDYLPRSKGPRWVAAHQALKSRTTAALVREDGS
jgi:hypothetical protein